jgi:hypothetical protein
VESGSERRAAREGREREGGEKARARAWASGQGRVGGERTSGREGVERAWACELRRTGAPRQGRASRDRQRAVSVREISVQQGMGMSECARQRCSGCSSS